MRQPVPALLVSAGQREVLEALARSSSAPHREVVRARALLMAADGLANIAIARELSVSPASVSGWRVRFAEEGLVKFAQVREGRGQTDNAWGGKCLGIGRPRLSDGGLCSPHSHRYQVTDLGIRVALFSTKVHSRICARACPNCSTAAPRPPTDPSPPPCTA